MFCRTANHANQRPPNRQATQQPTLNHTGKREKNTLDSIVYSVLVSISLRSNMHPNGLVNSPSVVKPNRQWFQRQTLLLSVVSQTVTHTLSHRYRLHRQPLVTSPLQIQSCVSIIRDEVHLKKLESTARVTYSTHTHTHVIIFVILIISVIGGCDWSGLVNSHSGRQHSWGGNRTLILHQSIELSSLGTKLDFVFLGGLYNGGNLLAN